MSESVWESEVVQIGSDTADFFAAGVVILFGQPVPDALAEVSLVHRGPSGPFAPIAVGDELSIGAARMVITEVGSRANENFEQLGHIVVYLNVGDQELLPGAVKAEGTLPAPVVGDRIVVTRTGA